jgi:hypothetical protein
MNKHELAKENKGKPRRPPREMNEDEQECENCGKIIPLTEFIKNKGLCSNPDCLNKQE